MRNTLPDEVGGVFWFGVDDARFTVYTPMYPCMTQTPESYRVGNGNFTTFSWTSAFWIHNWVANMAYARYSQMIQDTQPVQDLLENGFLMMQEPIETKAKELFNQSKEKAVEFLTSYSISQAQHATHTWKTLGEKLLVKYIDGVVKKEKEGKFEKNPYGKPAYPNRPVLNEKFLREIIRETGEKLKSGKIDD